MVAIVDSGFDLDHPDLRTRFLPGYDFCSELVRLNASVYVVRKEMSDPGYGQ